MMKMPPAQKQPPIIQKGYGYFRNRSLVAEFRTSLSDNESATNINSLITQDGRDTRSVEEINSGNGAHGDNERVSEESIKQMVQFVWYTILDIGGGAR